ncbi:macrolide transporter ATP-binding /permease protein [Tsuneonella dongtanensis]|uniref:Macrolide transporter ATP-binding /permease protein n=1 Tax=Tsuneonella dongtanensis TaxID=692370 RepID=A0A1B2AC99_9SPHN|nr:FtsX-like permease family protein [Tsuneonella dongtanensis]ANY19767.1 macrolide transporter ATP-binding /permease protein [Tsuneonella dongtanensis]
MTWGAAWRIARRDLSARFRGLRLLLVCLFLGTGALAAIGTLTGTIEQQLEERGREFLGGDLQVGVWQRALAPDELDALEELGTVSQGTRMQAMATTGEAAAPVELKAVDDGWPLYGTATLVGGRSIGAPPAGTAWVAQGAADRLGVAVGDRFSVGTAELEVGGILDAEPDRLGEGFQLGPTVIVRSDVPAAAGLTAPGAMYRTKTNVKFASAQDAQAAEDALKARFPNAGFEIRTRDRGAPGADRFVGRMGEFLTLVGLAALVIAGIGIGGGVSSYLDARRQGIATLKVLGATSADIARIYALEIGAAALVGSLAGIAVGVAVTPILASALDGLLPVGSGVTFAPGALLTALAYGLLVALVFAAPPLVRARHFPAMALMRERVSPLARDPKAVIPVLAGLAAIAALALGTARDPLLTAGFLAGAAGALALLALIGWGIRKGAAALPRPRDPLRRAALANLHRPGAATGTLVTALGFGLAAFVLLAAVQTSIDGTVARRVPAQAPDYFVLDLPKDRAAEFGAIVEKDAPGSEVRTVPALRGAILAYGPKDAMTRVATLGDNLPEGAWALRGERGLTYSTAVPEGNTVTEGEWWPGDYAEEPLVSVDEDLAQAIGLEVGDYLTIGVLGVERTARIASLRRIDWQTMGFNYVLVFSPNTLQDAPHNLAATVELKDEAGKSALLQSLVRAFPSSSVIETGPVLRQARDLLAQVGLATLAAASVAVLAGLAVLLGAIAAARAQRMYDTVVLRVLGASRRQVLVLALAEYGALAAVLAGVALAIGLGAAWFVVTQMFEFEWLPAWPAVFGVLGAGLALVVAFAMVGALPLLRAKPAQALRAL